MRRWIGIGIVALLGLGALVAVFSTARRDPCGRREVVGFERVTPADFSG